MQLTNALLGLVAGMCLAFLRDLDLSRIASIIAFVLKAAVNVALLLDALPNHMLWSLRRADDIPHSYYRRSNYCANETNSREELHVLFFVVSSWAALTALSSYGSKHRSAILGAVGLCRIAAACLNSGPSFWHLAPFLLSLHCLAWWRQKMHMPSLWSCRLLSCAVALALSDNLFIAALSAARPAYAPKAAAAARDEGSEPGREEGEQLVATEEEKVKFSKVNWVWCTICGGGSICKAGRRHKGDTGHEIQSLKSREQEQPGFMEQALQEFLRVQRHGKAARRELVHVHRQAELGAAGRDRPAVDDVYRMRFGSHKNKTIAELFNSSDSARAQYIPHLFACRNKSGPQDNLIELELARRREGWWERTVNVAQTLAPKVAEMSVVKLEDLERRVAAGDKVHPDVLREARLMAE